MKRDRRESQILIQLIVVVNTYHSYVHSLVGTVAALLIFSALFLLLTVVICGGAGVVVVVVVILLVCVLGALMLQLPLPLLIQLNLLPWGWMSQYQS